jgi:hypothetical protein
VMIRVLTRPITTRFTIEAIAASGEPCRAVGYRAARDTMPRGIDTTSHGIPRRDAALGRVGCSPSPVRSARAASPAGTRWLRRETCSSAAVAWRPSAVRCVCVCVCVCVCSAAVAWRPYAVRCAAQRRRPVSRCLPFPSPPLFFRVWAPRLSAPRDSAQRLHGNERRSLPVVLHVASQAP